MAHKPDDTPLEVIDGLIDVIKKHNPNLFKRSGKWRYMYPQVVSKYPLPMYNIEPSEVDVRKAEEILFAIFTGCNNINIMSAVMDIAKDLKMNRLSRSINRHIKTNGYLDKYEE